MSSWHSNNIRINIFFKELAEKEFQDCCFIWVLTMSTTPENYFNIVQQLLVEQFLFS